ncbi:MAG TPA: DEAD/DEAH box helicase [Cyclobacteriaceae bacterium]|nr:DEAD/DEAH box helicase [Cyclobacteriaceae bacterium]
MIKIQMLRDYQKEIVAEVLSRDDNTLIQADTGAGKTLILAAIARQYTHVLLIAHRNSLVSQLSLEFAKAGLYHCILAAKSTKRRAELLHRRHLFKSALSKQAHRFVCSIDTVLSKAKRSKLTIDCNERWLIIVDEAHHMIEENKWGKLCDIFKNARIVGATATPCRLDGVLLKRGKGGVFDTMVQSKSLKENSIDTLIKRGFISAFKCYGIEPRFDISSLKMGKHDYTSKSLIQETEKHVQRMAGDAVKHYKRLARDKQAVAFCVSINVAETTAENFKSSGIAAAAIHSKMSRTLIDHIFDLFESKKIQVLCNVDMTSEGVDIPAIECLIMLRKTASLTLYRQWVGRSLRPCTGKEFAVIIDHADNIKKHGLPDRHIEWSLDHAPSEQKSNLIACKECGALVKAWEKQCTECGYLLRINEINPRSVEYIDYMLVELYRTNAEQQSRDNAIASSVACDEISYLSVSGGKAAEMTNKVALWFFNNIKERVTRKQAEDFFFRHNTMQFWAKHFTLADMKKQNQKKCWRVFSESMHN